MSQQDLGFWGVGYDSAHVQCKGSLERWSVIFWFSLYVIVLCYSDYIGPLHRKDPLDYHKTVLFFQVPVQTEKV